MTKNQYKLQSRASEIQAEARKKLVELYRDSPLPLDHLMVNFGLYTRSSVLAKMLYVDELYRLIVNVPGVIMEFGVWWGANLALFESLRAIHEPYEYTRKIVGFDTFEGYSSINAKDGNHELVKEGQYDVGADYVQYLSELLDYHEVENTMSHVKKYELVKGDATVEIKKYLKDNPETLISLAYFDMQLYEPTKQCLEAIKPHLVKGAVVAMDELNSNEFPGETLALRETIGIDRYKMFKSRFLPDRTYFIIE